MQDSANERAYIQVVTATGIELIPIVKTKNQVKLDTFLNNLIGDTIEDLDIPVFIKNGIKYIARKDLEEYLGIDRRSSSYRDLKIRRLGLYFHPPETIKYEEYKARKRCPMRLDNGKTAPSLVLLSVDDAIIFVSYGQSNTKKLETIKKLIKELNKYRNISVNERKARLEDCWRFLLHYDDLAYNWIIETKEREKISLFKAYKLLWDAEIWRLGKEELYRYYHLKRMELPFYNESRLHHEQYIYKHLFTTGEIIPNKGHKRGRIGKII